MNIVKDKKVINGQNRAWKTYLLLFLGAFIFNSVVSIFFYYPNLNDEYNVLSIAACFAGKDWSEFASITKSYHGFGQAILYVPVFLLLDDPVWIYRAVLIVNSLLISLTVPVFYYLLNRYFDYVRPFHRILFAVTVGSLPFYISYAKNAWNEPMCAIVTMFIFVFALRWMDAWKKQESNFVNTAVLSVLVGYGYMVHGRMLVFAAVVPMALGLSVLFQSDGDTVKNNLKSIIKNICLYGIIFIALWLLSSQIKGFLYDHLWGHAGLNASVGDFAGRKFQYLLSFSNIKVLIKLMMGQVFYLIMTTYGLAIVAFLGAAIILIDGLRSLILKTEKHYGNIDCIFSFMIYGSYAAALLLSSISLLSGTLTEGVGRVDYVLYGRYTENIYPLIILFAILFLYKKVIKNEWRFWLVCDGIYAMFALCYLRFVVPLYLTLRRTGHSSITNILPFTGTMVVSGTNEEIYKGFFNVIIISLFLMFVLQGLFLWHSKKERNIVILCSILIFVSLYSYHDTITNRRIPSSINKYQSVNGIKEAFEEMELTKLSDRMYLVVDGSEYPAQYQWAFMDKDCIAFFDMDGSKIMENSVDILSQDGFVICQYDLNMDYILDFAYEILDERLEATGYHVWSVGDELKETLTARGIELSKDEECFYNVDELIVSSGIRFRSSWSLREREYLRSPSMYLPEGIYTIKIDGYNLDKGECTAVSSSLEKKQLIYLENIEENLEDIEESLKYSIDIIDQQISAETVYLKVRVNCGVRDFQVYVKNINTAYITVNSIELMKD